MNEANECMSPGEIGALKIQSGEHPKAAMGVSGVIGTQHSK